MKGQTTTSIARAGASAIGLNEGNAFATGEMQQGGDDAPVSAEVMVNE
jgi:hypothetical protein